MSNISLSFDNNAEQIKSMYDDKIKNLTEELEHIKKNNMVRMVNNKIGGMINNSDNCKQNIEMNNLNSNNINEERVIDIDENFININILSSIEKPDNFNLIKLLIDNISDNLDFYINEDIIKSQLRDYLFFCIKLNIGNFKNKCSNCNTQISNTNSTGLCGNFFCQNQFNLNFNKNLNNLNYLNKKFNRNFNA